MIIGFTGAARSGKNEAAKVLEDMLGFKQLSFAAPLREFIISFLDLSGMEEFEQVKELPHHLFGGKSPRQVMQMMGTEFGREMIFEDIWVNRCLEMADKVENAVIFDVRFENEAEMLVRRGGKIINIHRPDVVTTKHSDHASEAGIDPKYIWQTISNDSDIVKFRLKVLDTVRELL